MKIFFVSLGCDKNLVDSEHMLGILQDHGYSITDDEQQADIIVAAVGKAGFVTEEMVKPGAVIVDVGINVTDHGITGDVAPEALEKASAYTPVPGGVGVVSNVMMMDALTAGL